MELQQTLMPAVIKLLLAGLMLLLLPLTNATCQQHLDVFPGQKQGVLRLRVKGNETPQLLLFLLLLPVEEVRRPTIVGAGRCASSERQMQN
jgi:hypothetical protein